MSFSSYNNYKASGLDWLPCVPAQWNLRKISWHLPYVVGWTPPSGDEKYYDGDYPWVTIADMTNGSVSETQSKITAKAVEERNASIVPAGSMLFSFKLSVGKVAFLEVPAYTNEAIAAFLVNEHVDLGFWKYAAPEIVPMYGRKNIYGALLLNQDLIGSVRFYCPSLKEQKKIAEFLDHETAKIDALITEQQRLIELLREKRQAVISHAVTKGLNPDTPMKDSGVEWLGEVPAHWDVLPIKRLTKIPITDGPHETPTWVDEGVPFISAEAVSTGEIDFDKARFISEADHHRYSKKYHPEKNDIFMVKSGATTGVTAIVRTDRDFNIWSPLAVIRCNESVVPEFVLYAMRSRAFQESVTLSWSFGTQQNIGMGVIENLPLPVPAKDEQRAIVRHIKREASKWEELIGESQRAIGFLNERRSALISAAVTGKIDVRNWNPKGSKKARARGATGELVQEEMA